MEQASIQQQQNTNTHQGTSISQNTGQLGRRLVDATFQPKDSNKNVSPLAYLFLHNFIWKTLEEFACYVEGFRKNHWEFYEYTTTAKHKDIHKILCNLRLVCRDFRDAAYQFLPKLFSVCWYDIQNLKEKISEQDIHERASKKRKITVNFNCDFFPKTRFYNLLIASEENLHVFNKFLDISTNQNIRDSIVVQKVFINTKSAMPSPEILNALPNTVTSLCISDISGDDKPLHRPATGSYQLALPSHIKHYSGEEITGFCLDLSPTQLETVNIDTIGEGGNCILPQTTTTFSCRREEECHDNKPVLDFTNTQLQVAYFINDKEIKLPLTIKEVIIYIGGFSKPTLDLSLYKELTEVTLYSDVDPGFFPTINLILPPNIQKLKVENEIAINFSNIEFSQFNQLSFMKLNCPLTGKHTFPISLQKLSCAFMAGEFDFSQCPLHTFYCERLKGTFKFPTSITDFKSLAIFEDTVINLSLVKNLQNIEVVTHISDKSKLILSKEHHSHFVQTLTKVQKYIEWV